MRCVAIETRRTTDPQPSDDVGIPLDDDVRNPEGVKRLPQRASDSPEAA